MNDLIQILLKAEIDSKSIQNIQGQIDKIAKSAQSIKINVSMDDTALKVIENINKTLANANANKLNESMNSVGNSAKNVSQAIEGIGVSITQTFRDKTNNVIKVVDTIEDGARRIKNSYADLNRTQFTGSVETDSTVKVIENNKKNNEILKERILLYQKEQELKIKNMQGRYGSLLDSNALDQYRQKLNQFVVEMSNLGDKTTPKVSNKLKEFNLDLRQIETNARNSKQALDLTNKSAMSFGESLKVAANKFLIWSTVTTAYFATIREIRSGLKYVTEMDTALTEIAMVTGQNRNQVAGLAMEYNNLAKEMKVLTSDVSAGAVEFYRQGLSQEKVFENLQQNIQYAKVSNLDYSRSAEILTATVNSMGVSIQRASDVFAYLGDATATGKMCPIVA